GAPGAPGPALLARPPGARARRAAPPGLLAALAPVRAHPPALAGRRARPAPVLVARDHLGRGRARPGEVPVSLLALQVRAGLSAVGHYLIDRTLHAGYALILGWRAIRWVRSPKQLWKRRHMILRQMFVAGVQSLPVTLVVGIFIGFLLAYSAGIELARYGQQAVVGQLVAAAVCREFGPFMTGIILAANVGSSMAAELGTMKVSEEIDALEVM